MEFTPLWDGGPLFSPDGAAPLTTDSVLLADFVRVPECGTASFTAYTETEFNDEQQVELARFVDEMSKKGAQVLWHLNGGLHLWN